MTEPASTFHRKEVGGDPAVARGEVTLGDRHLSGGAFLAGWQFGYGYDTIGNRLTATTGGDSAGANRRGWAYTPNALNQYTDRSVPGYADLLGSSTADAVITMNGQAVDRQGAAWRKELAVDNTAGPAVTNVGIAGTRGADTAPAQNGKRFVAKTPEVFTYDDDGNLTSDGRSTYDWDAENRLRSVATSLAAVAAGAMAQRADYTYDYRSRRSAVTPYQPAVLTPLPPIRSLYDEWNLLAEFDSAGAVLRSYAWGLDLSGTRHGAGGVGGLLLFSERASGSPSQHAVATDENGNVMALIDTASGALSARYEYGPFGEPLRATGPMAKGNPFRWSTRYWDDETGIVMYPRRGYQPSTGRWLSRDPVQERGGFNLYAFARNNAVSLFDPFASGKGSGE